MVRRIGSTAMTGIFLCLALGSVAQQVPPQSNPPPRLIPRTQEEREEQFRSEHRLILNVLVTDATGKPVAGLKEDDFTLLDNNQQQPLASFRAATGRTEPTPPHVILLIDALSNTRTAIVAQTDVIQKFLKQSPGPLLYPTSIASLTDTGISVKPAATDRVLLESQISALALAHALQPYRCSGDKGSHELWTPLGGDQSVPIMTSSGTKINTGCLNQRFRLSVTALNRFAVQQTQVPGRILLIWLGAGWPWLSGPGFLPNTAALKQNFFCYLVQLTNTLREAQITLDNLVSRNDWQTARSQEMRDLDKIRTVPTEETVNAKDLSLQALGGESGGLVRTDRPDLSSDIAQCMADAATYYVLQFDSGTAAQLDEYHSLHVDVKQTGLTVRTNAGYFAEQ